MASSPSSALVYAVMTILALQATVASAANITINGNSAFDNQVNKILHWDGTRESLGVGPDIIAGVAIAVGLVLVFLGYKLIRPAMFISAFAVGAVLSFVIFENAFRDKSYVDTACWIAFAVGGLLLGALVVCLYPVGVFLLGAFAGLLLATQLQTSFGYAIAPAHENIVFIVLLVVCGLLCGALALWIERPFFIVATSWSGAIAAVWGIGYFAGGYPNAANLQKHMSGDKWVYDVPNAWWGYLAGTVVLALIGMWVQFRNTPQPQPQAVVGQPVTYVAVSTPVKGNPIRHV
ncbi:Aste57867_10132 [Aphanomyces stellatus]|uniref:Transmembrane protein 198 n=1 Tax=Aphanomyces stellatus TaxID=120398 RepID=A0A485KQB6_9STRA|nr:hypothetical protein As57867_010093 [Aphanomyces stellatus]VFT87008.1 Aste57867_10132 [Aphanomyces stellatus]